MLEELKNSILERSLNNMGLATYQMAGAIMPLFNLNFYWYGDTGKEMRLDTIGRTQRTDFEKHVLKFDGITKFNPMLSELLALGLKSELIKLAANAANMHSYLYSHTSLLKGKSGLDPIRSDILAMNKFALHRSEVILDAINYGVDIPLLPEPDPKAEALNPCMVIELGTAAKKYLSGAYSRDNGRMWHMLNKYLLFVYRPVDDYVFVMDGTISWTPADMYPKYEGCPKNTTGMNAYVSNFCSSEASKRAMINNRITDKLVFVNQLFKREIHSDVISKLHSDENFDRGYPDFINKYL